jgi:coproporphyrinogen III oxidase-like Fe-S oxidoreductase
MPLAAPMSIAPLLSLVLRRVTARRLTFDTIGGVALPAAPARGVSTLYLHVPFCEQLCPYCSFNRYPYEADAASAYFVQLRAELRAVRDLGYRFRSLYVGGGTPTVRIDELCATIDLARDLFGPLEVSCETNPNHLTPDRLGQLQGRVQRLSVGVQSFDDGLLAAMRRRDRYGTGAEAFAAVAAAVGSLPVLNIDLIYNLPGQTAGMLARDIAFVRDSGAQQVTFYPLMPSAQDAPPTLRAALARLRSEERFYRQIVASVGGELQPSSAWCFSRAMQAPIDEYIVSEGDYVGVGAGAFSFVDGTLYANAFSLDSYASAVGPGRHSAAAARRFAARDRMRYTFLMDLFGLNLDKTAFRRQHGVTVDRGLPVEMTFMRLAGAFERDDDKALTLTPGGRYLLVAMMREFFVGVSRLRDQARAVLGTARLGAA